MGVILTNEHDAKRVTWMLKLIRKSLVDKPKFKYTQNQADRKFLLLQDVIEHLQKYSGQLNTKITTLFQALNLF